MKRFLLNLLAWLCFIAFLGSALFNIWAFETDQGSLVWLSVSLLLFWFVACWYVILEVSQW